MGEALAGNHATWEFDTDSVLIRFERGIRTPKLFQSLRERRIPYAALAAVTLTPGKRGTVVVHAVPRAGADPLTEAAAGQLAEGNDPFRLVVPPEHEAAAVSLAAGLRGALGPDAAEPADRFLVAAPEGPLHFKAYDGRAGFDGSAVSFRWSWTGASSAKWKAGDQTFPVGELAGIEWRSPESAEGYLRLLPRTPAGAAPAGPGTAIPVTSPAAAVLAPGSVGQVAGGAPGAAPPVDQDPTAVLFGRGYGPVHESLPFAAAVLESLRRARPTPVPAVPVGAGRSDPADVAERIRHLGELHGAGLVTDGEYSAKKAQLLAEL
ncbi:DUF4429 domain-containing protein [uncultured Streptomyces sp.]|uniref:DUF4429 domain-containing protein n=1 Tax=uncultured Streptomyces sp. TaxID=174707 RepID=UPI00261D1521|nr:DUF4429 domain-containing protein [uncultured Streptomyces sp.]